MASNSSNGKVMNWKELNIAGNLQSPCLTPVILHSFCSACKQPLETEKVAYCMGHPYYCMVHKSCVPFFDYKKGYPHDRPMQCYEPDQT